jgi:hypothetical protein
MNAAWYEELGGWRIAVAGLLFVLAGGLFVASLQLGHPPEAYGYNTRDIQLARRKIDAAIDSVFIRQHVDPHKVKTRDACVIGSSVLRRESVIEAPADFVSLVFNFALQKEIVPLGARLIASEHTKDETVVMHVRTGGVIVRTLVFIEHAGTDPSVGSRMKSSNDH